MMDGLFSDFDWENFSESGSSEGHGEIDFLYGGWATSILSSLEDSIGKIDDFLSFDRGFMHGDIVCSVTDPSGQMGRVINKNMLVDLESIHGNIIKSVDSRNILNIRSISVGDYVVLGAWLGRVDKVIDSVTVVFDDGSKCEVTAVDNEQLLPISTNLLEDSEYPYYPGQRVRVSLSNVSTSVTWLCGTRRENQVEGMVCDVDAGVVYVDWLASAFMGSDLNLAAPPSQQDPKNLTLLSGFSLANWQIGDWCMLPTANHKGIMEPTFINSSTCDNKKLEPELKRRNPTSSLAESFVIVKTKTKVDVVWQDGSCSLGLDSQVLLPVSVVNSHEFWPDQFVLEKGICDDPHISNGQRWGVVLGVDAKERIVTVQWKAKSKNEATDFDVNQEEETLSAYELVEHPDYSFSYGDVVFKLVQNQFVTCKEAALEGKISGCQQNDCHDTHYPSCIGIITGFKDGSVEVRWATGFTTKVGPNEIYRVEKYEGPATTAEPNEGELNQEILDKETSSQRGKTLPNFDGSVEVFKKYLWESSFFSLPHAAIGFFKSIATSLFEPLGSTSQSGSVSSGLIPENGNETEILLENETSDICRESRPSELQTVGKTNLNHEVGENPQKEEFKAFAAGENPEDHFRQFDMVSDSSDHHFLGDSKGLSQSQVKRTWVKKVQQEWSILVKNLPETIYVRIFEDRMDLIRAAIVGAEGTPYHDGLFFFDIFLPPEYPYEPPLVHYISGGLRINPNLYESGKVCLSLLKTWTGSGTEVWNPGSSTVLQVLLSLQALVLNEKPYFNEAGYDIQIGRAEGERNSISYNENAFLVTCKSMLYLLHKPPEHFKELVEEHFSRRSIYILLACKAYIEGAAVGSAFGCLESGETPPGCSTGFKIMLAKLFPKLVEAFSSKGIDCSQLIEPEK